MSDKSNKMYDKSNKMYDKNNYICSLIGKMYNKNIYNNVLPVSMRREIYIKLKRLKI